MKNQAIRLLPLSYSLERIYQLTVCYFNIETPGFATGKHNLFKQVTKLLVKRIPEAENLKFLSNPINNFPFPVDNFLSFLLMIVSLSLFEQSCFLKIPYGRVQ